MAFGICCGSTRKGVGALSVIRFCPSTTPLRKVMDEMWPSPVARKLRMNRNASGGRLDWSGCGTMEGLNKAAASKEYSWVK